MSHLASADVPGDASVAEQTAIFHRILAAAADRGIDPQVRHLANTAALIDHPDTHFDLARVGIGAYGLNPVATPTPLTAGDDPAGHGRADQAGTGRAGRLLRPDVPDRTGRPRWR